MDPIELLDSAKLNFSPGALMALNGILGLIMFGVALDIRPKELLGQLKSPKAVTVGLIAQLFALPALSLGLIWLLSPPASVALGMILLASCPGGNVSNFLTLHGKGRVEVSVLMTSAVSILASITTPLNLAVWGNLYPPTRALMRSVEVDPLKMWITIVGVLVVPLAAGMAVNSKFPAFADRLKKPFSWFSMIALAGFVIGALASNGEAFVLHLPRVFFYVVLHNALAFLLGYVCARVAKLPEPERRAISFEVGIQNTALGLVLVFGFFEGLGGMAIIVAWWGVWHLLSGFTLATWWSKRPPQIPTPAVEPAKQARLG